MSVVVKSTTMWSDFVFSAAWWKLELLNLENTSNLLESNKQTQIFLSATTSYFPRNFTFSACTELSQLLTCTLKLKQCGKSMHGIGTSAEDGGMVKWRLFSEDSSVTIEMLTVWVLVLDWIYYMLTAIYIVNCLTSRVRSADDHTRTGWLRECAISLPHNSPQTRDGYT